MTPPRMRWLVILALLVVPGLAQAEGWLLMVPPNTWAPPFQPSQTLLELYKQGGEVPEYERAVKKQLDSDLAAPLLQWTRETERDVRHSNFIGQEVEAQQRYLYNLGVSHVPDSWKIWLKLLERDVLTARTHEARWAAARCLPASLVPVP
jgi:hypothetical protein